MRRLLRRLNLRRVLRERREEKAARARMSPAQLAVVDAFGIPARIVLPPAALTPYENAEAEKRAWAAHVLAPENQRRRWNDAGWPTRPGVQPVSVSHDKRCNPWSTFGGCHVSCTAPDRRISPLRDDEGRFVR